MSFAYLPFYTGDYFRDTRGLSMAGHGCYFLLLTYCWDAQGPLPLDEERIAGICEARSQDERHTMMRVLQSFFVRMDDGWYNGRMQREIERSHAIGLMRKVAGAKGYLARAKHLPSKSQASAKQVHLSPPPSPSPSPSPSPASENKPKSKASAPPTGGTWQAYADAYFARYNVDPVRNAQVNSQLANLVKRLGATEAPHVAASYLKNQNSFYVNAGHPVSLLLRDAEKLRTEWANGHAVTSSEARRLDQGTAANPFSKMLTERKP